MSEARSRPARERARRATVFMANEWYWRGCAERDVDLERAVQEWETLEPSTRIRRFNASLASGDSLAMKVFDEAIAREKRIEEQESRQQTFETAS